MLKLLVDVKHSSNCIIIEDELSAPADDLLLAIIKNHATLKHVQLICVENPPKYYQEKEGVPEITCHDLCSDPCGWLVDETPVAWNKQVHCDKLKEQVVIIDSLSLLIQLEEFDNLYINLHNLLKDVDKLIAFVHGDCVAGYELEKLGFLSRTYLKVLKNNTIEILYKKPGGKVMSVREVFCVDAEYNIQSVKSKPEVTTKQVPSSTKADMEQLTTFKLGLDLSESEKAAKSQLVLPYLRRKAAPESKIIYQAEPEDDLEDDPDDDLDF